MKYPHTLAIFTNDKLKIFHIWQTRQEKNVKQNVSVTNLFSKAKWSLSGKDSAQSPATTSVMRVVLSTNQSDWSVKHIYIGDVDKSELEIVYELEEARLVAEGFTRITRDPRIRLQSGKYSGRKWVARLIENMKLDQIKEHARKMLEDCLNPNLDIDSLKNKIASHAINRNSSITNLSLLWKYIYENYGDKYYNEIK